MKRTCTWWQNIVETHVENTPQVLKEKFFAKFGEFMQCDPEHEDDTDWTSIVESRDKTKTEIQVLGTYPFDYVCSLLIGN